MIIYAPYPQINQLIVLPQPLLRNQVQAIDIREYQIMMDKSVHSCVKRAPGLRYIYRFHLTREKAEELWRFIRTHNSAKWYWTDHHSDTFIGYYTADTAESTVDLGPLTTCAASVAGFSPNERLNFDLELETCAP